MSKFIDKLGRLSRGGSQAIGFKAAQSVSPKPQIQLVASLAQEGAEKLAGSVAGADAGLLRISKLSSAGKVLQQICRDLPDIPWGGWLQDSSKGGMKQITRAGCDFIVFPASNTPLALLQGSDEPGKILEVEASLSENLLRTANELPVDAVLIAGGQGGKGSLLTWQDLMLFQRFADLLIKPLLVFVPSEVTPGELEALWGAGADGVVVEVGAELPQSRLKELRQAIDKITFPSPRRRKKSEPLPPRLSRGTGVGATEEEEEE